MKTKRVYNKKEEKIMEIGNTVISKYTCNLQNLEIEEGGLRQLFPMITEVSSVLEDHMIFLLRATCIINSHFVEPLEENGGLEDI